MCLFSTKYANILQTSSSNAAVSNSLQNHASESVLWTGSPPAANSLLSATANPYSPAAGTAIYFQVCREFQRGSCARAADCRFAHPPPGVTIDDGGRVTVCMDYVKGRCSRELCRYFHPPLHLLSHLLLKSASAAHTAASPPSPLSQQPQLQPVQQQFSLRASTAAAAVANSSAAYASVAAAAVNNATLVGIVLCLKVFLCLSCCLLFVNLFLFADYDMLPNCEYMSVVLKLQTKNKSFCLFTSIIVINYTC